MNSPLNIFLGLLCAATLGACSSSVRFSSTAGTETGRTGGGQPARPGEKFRGMASYYHDKFDGRTTSNGEVFRQDQLTAAHRTLPFGTVVEVRNLKNNRTVIVRINDRGPFAEGRIIDLSRRAAEELDMIRTGTSEVEITIM